MSENLNVEVDSEALERARKVLDEAGVSLDTAINRYLCAIAVTRHLPYGEDIPLPETRPSSESRQMSLEELSKQVMKNYADASSQSIEMKHIFAEIERRYGL